MKHDDKLLTRFNPLGIKEIWAVRVGAQVIPIAGGDGTAEMERKKGENGRVEAESARASAERSRAAAEKARVQAEQGRATAEASRASAESKRASADSARASAEASRAEAETARVAAEASRSEAEKSRSTAEVERERKTTEAVGSIDASKNAADKAAKLANDAAGKADAGESTRVSAETARAAAERERETAEAERASQQAKNNADQVANNAAAQGLQVVKLTDGQYDPSTLEPTVHGEVGKLYFVPDAKRGDGNLYREWMLIDGEWEQVGMSSASITGLTTNEIDRISDGQSVVSESVLTGNGLTYLWAKQRNAYAPASHKHAMPDLTGVADAISSKADATHRHGQGDVDGLADALSGKADARHTHDKGDVDGLDTALAGKANARHDHAIDDVSGLQAALDAKADKGSGGDFPQFKYGMGYLEPSGSTYSSRIYVPGLAPSSTVVATARYTSTAWSYKPILLAKPEANYLEVRAFSPTNATPIDSIEYTWIAII